MLLPRHPSQRWATVLAARAVARSWQVIFDQFFLRSCEYTNTLRSEQISLYHPLSASAATGARVGCGLGGTYSTLAFLRDLTEITFEKPYGSVVYLSPRLVRRPAPWSALTTLTIELTSLPSILSETIHEMLSALKGLNQLRFAAPQRSSAVDARTTDWITVLRRLPANITRFGVLAKSEGKTPINSLLAVLRTYLPPSVEELELVLPTVYTRQPLSLMLPPAVKRVSIECQRALCVPLLELLADPTILPELVQGPAISFTVADTVESSEIRLPTFKSVQAAVAGMNRRLRIADKKGAEHFLYKLLEDSGMSPSQ